MTVSIIPLPEELKEALREIGIIEPTPIQRMGWPTIFAKRNALLVAPTGSGKMEAAMVPILANLLLSSHPTRGVRVIYVTPLRALNRDMLRRLQFLCSRVGLEVGVRHGDTSRGERRRQVSHPPDILITTPETLYIMLLNRKTREILMTVEWIVLDELHELFPTKRGSHLVATLTVLSHFLKKSPVKVGLSATVYDPRAVASYFLGEATVHVAGYSREMEIDIIKIEPTAEDRTSGFFPLWSAVSRKIHDLIREWGTTLLFVNTRSTAEQLAHTLKELYPELMVEAHHGSLSQEIRVRGEEGLKYGRIEGLIATSSMELGIDIGHIKYVIQVGSPRQATHLVQRIGRSHHRIGETARGGILTTSDSEYYEAQALVKRAKNGEFEPVSFPKVPLDVLAQMTVALLFIREEWGRKGVNARILHSMLSSGPPFEGVSFEKYEKILRFLHRERIIRYESGLVKRARRSFEFKKGHFSTITSFKKYAVIDSRNNVVIGHLDERFVLSRDLVDKKIVLAGRVWRVIGIESEKVMVVETTWGVDIIPSWIGEEIPVERETAQEAARMWHKKNPKVPLPNIISIEGKPGKVVVVWSPHGTRINGVIASYLEYRLHKRGYTDIYTMYDAYRIAVISRGGIGNYMIEEENIGLLHYLVREILLSNPGRKEILHGLREFSMYEWFFAKVAQRFGIIESDASITYNDIAKIRRFYGHTIIAEEALKEMIHEQLDIDGALEIFEKLNSGEIELQCKTTFSPPTIEYVLSLRKMIGFMSEGDLYRNYMEYILSKEVRLTCVRCGNAIVSKIKDIPDFPSCKCGSRLLMVSARNDDLPQKLIIKWRKTKQLSPEESATIKKYYRSAPLVLNYGKKAIFALAIYGIGPTTASKILGRFPPDAPIDENFIETLMRAQESFIRTRQYWNRD